LRAVTWHPKHVAKFTISSRLKEKHIVTCCMDHKKQVK
jgi:hypothetical protein